MNSCIKYSVLYPGRELKFHHKSNCAYNNFFSIVKKGMECLGDYLTLFT